jgi:hypothetical protein
VKQLIQELANVAPKKTSRFRKYINCGSRSKNSDPENTKNRTYCAMMYLTLVLIRI